MKSYRVPGGIEKGSLPCKCEEMDAAYRLPLLLLLHLYQEHGLDEHVLDSDRVDTHLFADASCLVFTRFST